jgi:dipicolinate synthase subunit A
MTYQMPEMSSIDWKTLKIAIVGGDEREQEIARLAVETGANVSVFGFPIEKDGLTEATISKTATESIKDADFILFPIPGMSQDGSLFSNEKIYPDQAMLSGAKSDAHIIMGLPHPNLTEVCQKLDLRLHEYETDKELMMLRMPSIVELALKIIIENTKVSIHGSSIVVIGQGNVAHTLTRNLILLGANVTVAARNSVQRAQAIVIGAKAITLDKLGDAVTDCDICLSSVPALLITKEVIDLMPKSIFIADFAAPPGGVDFNYARSKNINCVWARGLGRRAPITVGRSQWKGIAERIIAIVKERK